MEEEVTTEIIKTEIQTEEDSDQFLVKHEVVEYEEDVKKVFVSKVSLVSQFSFFFALNNKWIISVKFWAAPKPCEEREEGEALSIA